MKGRQGIGGIVGTRFVVRFCDRCRREDGEKSVKTVRQRTDGGD